MCALAALILTSCSLLQEPDGANNIRINLPPIVSAAGNSRAISADRLPTLRNQVRKYRVTVNGMVREGTGTTYEFTLAVGTQATITVECLNDQNEVIIRAVKEWTVTGGENNVAITLRNDGDEIIPASAAGRVTYSYGEADKHGNKNGIPSDPTTYSEGDVFTVEDGSGMTWDHASQSGFTGWKTNVALVGDTDSSTADVQANGDVQVGGKYKMPRGGVTLTAQWNKKSYSITYQKNEANSGGTPTQSVPGTSSVEALASANISSDTPPQVSTGSVTYSFTGWNTQAGGGGTPYRAGQQITMMTEDITLYAQWTSANVYTVTYNIGNGPTAADSGWVANDTYTEGISSAITFPTLTATGYTFNGWQITGESNNRGGGTSYTPTGSVTATAQWTPITYSITYNADGGNVNPSSGATEFDVLTGSINFPQADGKTGYRLDYWKAADGTNVTGMGGEQLAALVPSGSTTLALTAVWREETYNITYTVANGEGTGTVSASFTITQNGGQVTLNGGTTGFTRSGYRIASWKYDDNSSAGNAGAQVAASALIAKAGGSTSLQLTAVWTPIQYTITYNANGGGNNPGNTIFTVADGTITLDAGSSLSKAGSTFAGWSTQQNGTAITDTSAQALIGLMSGSNTSVTLYAVWIQKPASLSTNGGAEQFYDSFTDAWAAMEDAVNNVDPDVPYVVKMYEDATLTSTLEPAGADVKLDLNGHTLDGSGLGSQMPVIRMSFNGEFTLADSSSQATGTIKGASSSAVSVSGTQTTPIFNMTGGKITGVNSSDSGGGVYVIYSGIFNMSGGTITGNTASDGGGVYVDISGAFNMSGGTISGNTATGSTATGRGGGVYVATGGTFNISGNVQITGNQKNGGADSNVYLAGNGSAMINLTGTLNAASRIGVTLETSGTFTSDWNANKGSAVATTVFTSDDAGLTVAESGGELELQ